MLPPTVIDKDVGVVVANDVGREGEEESDNGERGTGELDGEISNGFILSLCRKKAASGVSPGAT